MATNIKKGILYVRDGFGIDYSLCVISEKPEGDDFSFTFEPFYDVIDIVPSALFDGIQGLNLSLRKEKYYREGIPTFIAERVPPRNRENLSEILAEYHMEYWDPLVYLLRTKNSYFGDRIRVKEFQEKKEIDLRELQQGKDTAYAYAKNVLEALGSFNEIRQKGKVLNGEERRSLYACFYPLFEKLYANKARIEKAKSIKQTSIVARPGKKPIVSDTTWFAGIAKQYKAKAISLDDALRITNLSRATFFRYLKKVSNHISE